MYLDYNHEKIVHQNCIGDYYEIKKLFNYTVDVLKM